MSNFRGVFYLSVILLFEFFDVFAQQTVPSFEHFDVSDGLSHSTIYSIVQDSEGFVWIGTEDGLNRYDGYQFLNFYHDPSDQNSLSSSNSNVLLVEDESHVWVGTWGGGANRFNIKTFTSERFFPIADSPKSLSGQRVQSLFKDANGQIWIGTADNGLSRFNAKSRTFDRVTYSPLRPQSLSNNRVWAITQDSGGFLWIGTSSGLNKLHAETLENQRFPELAEVEIRALTTDTKGVVWIGTRKGLYTLKNDELQPFSINGNHLDDIINRVYQDDEGEMWISTMNSGVYHLIESLELVNHYSYNPDFEKSLQHNDVRIVFRDKSGVVWLGSRGSGLSKLDIKKQRFGHQLAEPKHQNNPEYNRVWAVFIDKKDRTWIGTDYGLKRFSANLAKEDRFSPQFEGLKNEIVLVRAIFEASDGKIYVGTSGQGMFVSENDGKSFKSIPIQGSSSNLNIRRARHIAEINNEIWVSTQEGVFRLEKGRFVPTLSDVSQSHIRHFLFDTKNQLWMATLDGLILVNPDLNQVREFRNTPSDETSLSFDGCTAVLEAKDGAIWVGTTQGLNRLDVRTMKFRQFFRRDGLSNHVINGLLEDDAGNIWVSTNRGLSKIEAETFKIHNFDVHAGLQGNIFMTGAFHKSSSGKLGFGGFSGFNVFNPKEITPSSFQPTIAITDFRVFDTSRPLNRNPQKPLSVDLYYTDNFISFDVASLDYTIPSRNKFAYKLSGINDEWVGVNNGRTIKYTNLSHGDYTLTVRGSNSDGVWSKNELQLTLRIIPPFWKTTWFLGLVGVCLLAFIGGTSYNYVHNLRSKNTSLSGKVQQSKQELREREELFRLISENAMDWILVLNEEFVLDYCSPAVELLLGVEPKEVHKKGLQHFVHPKDYQRFKAQTKESISTNIPINAAFSFLDAGNQERVLELSGSTILDRSQSKKLLVLIAHDITDRIEVERSLRKAKRESDKANKTKSAFLAGMSHELRTPLNAILGFSQILGNDSNLSDKHKNYVDILQRSGTHLLSMINDVLDLSKIEAGKMELHVEDADVQSLVQDLRSIFAIQAREKNLGFTMELDKSLPAFIESDGNKIRQILINFLGNAIKYSEEGSVVLTGRFYQEKPDFNIFANEGFKRIDSTKTKTPSYLSDKNAGYLYFSVADTGPGIAANQISEIFKPFKQTGASRSKGTGLGLAISLSLVQLLGGHVFVKTELGKGSNFVVLIPAIPIQSSKPIPGDSQKIVGIKGNDKKSVLVLDDIETNIYLLTELLEPVGFTCYPAYSGEEAIEVFKKYTPDILLFDLRLPGITGEQTLKIIRKLKAGKDVPAIAVTASVLDENREEVMQAGFQGFIHKPIKASEIFDYIARVSDIEFSYDSGIPSGEDKSDSMEVLIAEIAKLDTSIRTQLIDSLELTDFDALETLSLTLPKTPVFDSLRNQIKNKNLTFILETVEVLEKHNLA